MVRVEAIVQKVVEPEAGPDAEAGAQAVVGRAAAEKDGGVRIAQRARRGGRGRGRRGRDQHRRRTSPQRPEQVIASNPEHVIRPAGAAVWPVLGCRRRRGACNIGQVGWHGGSRRLRPDAVAASIPHASARQNPLRMQTTPPGNEVHPRPNRKGVSRTAARREMDETESRPFAIGTSRRFLEPEWAEILNGRPTEPRTERPRNKRRSRARSKRGAAAYFVRGSLALCCAAPSG